jgi:NlpC/P60 family putative phage cell wall peptidase
MSLALHIVATARLWIGTPYLHQASLKGVGCDCLGLVRGVWREIYGSEPFVAPPYSPDWAEAGGVETLADAARQYMRALSLADAAAGDLLLFRWREGAPAKHCSILTGTTTMVHAHDGASVSEVAVGRWWQRHKAFAFRFPDAAV